MPAMATYCCSHKKAIPKKWKRPTIMEKCKIWWWWWFVAGWEKASYWERHCEHNLHGWGVCGGNDTLSATVYQNTLHPHLCSCMLSGKPPSLLSRVFDLSLSVLYYFNKCLFSIWVVLSLMHNLLSHFSHGTNDCRQNGTQVNMPTLRYLIQDTLE